MLRARIRLSCRSVSALCRSGLEVEHFGCFEGPKVDEVAPTVARNFVFPRLRFISYCVSYYPLFFRIISYARLYAITRQLTCSRRVWAPFNIPPDPHFAPEHVLIADIRLDRLLLAYRTGCGYNINPAIPLASRMFISIV